MKEFCWSSWDMHDKVLVTACAFFFGMIIGFAFSPVKKGIYCGNHNGNRQCADTKQNL